MIGARNRILRRSFARLSLKLAFGPAVLALVTLTALRIMLPVFHFPTPGGPYAIGTLTYHWVDADRADIFSADASARREPEGAFGFRQMHTFRVEALVSQGYIVAAIDQAHTAAVVVFPEGREVGARPLDQMLPLIPQCYSPARTWPVLPGPAFDKGIVPYLPYWPPLLPWLGIT